MGNKVKTAQKVPKKGESGVGKKGRRAEDTLRPENFFCGENGVLRDQGVTFRGPRAASSWKKIRPYRVKNDREREHPQGACLLLHEGKKGPKVWEK